MENPLNILDRANAEVKVTQLATVLDKDKKPTDGGEPRYKYVVRSKFTKEVILTGEKAGTKLDAINAAAKATQKKLKIEPPKSAEEKLDERLTAIEKKSAEVEAENAELKKQLEEKNTPPAAKPDSKK